MFARPMSYDGFRGKIPLKNLDPLHTACLAQETEDQEAELELLQDKSKDQGEWLDEVNLAAHGEKPRTIFVSASCSER